MSLKSKLELAISAEIAGIDGLDSTLAANCYTGQDNEDHEMPCCVVNASSGEEMPLGSSNYFMNVAVTVKGHSGESSALADHPLNVGHVFNHMRGLTIAALISFQLLLIDAICPSGFTIK